MRTPFGAAMAATLLVACAPALRAESRKTPPLAVEIDEPALGGRLANGTPEFIVVRVTSRDGSSGPVRITIGPQSGYVSFGETSVEATVPAQGTLRVPVPVLLQITYLPRLPISATVSVLGNWTTQGSVVAEALPELSRAHHTVVFVGESRAETTRLKHRLDTFDTKSVPEMGGRMGGSDEALVETLIATPESLADGTLPLAAADILWIGPNTPPLSPAVRERLARYVTSGGILVDRIGTDITTTGWGRVVDDATPLLAGRLAWIGLLRPHDNRLAPSRELQQNTFLGSAPFGDPLDRIRGMDAPSPSTLIGYLFGFLLLAVPGQYFLLRRLKRPSLAWVATPLLAVSFSLAAHRRAVATRPVHEVVNQRIWLEAAPGARTATGQLAIGLYSASGGTYAFAPGIAGAIPGDAAAGGWHVPTNPVDGGTIDSVRLAPWSVRTHEWTLPSVPLGHGVSAFVRQNGPATYELIVRNGTDWTLDAVRATAASPDREVTIAPGQTVVIPLDGTRLSTFSTRTALNRVVLEGAFAAHPNTITDGYKEYPVSGPRLALTGRLRGFPVATRVNGRRVDVQHSETWLMVPLLPEAPLPLVR
ncbi:MAG: hypothetical protein ACKO5K_12755 [Armatimonadota bacterium]